MAPTELEVCRLGRRYAAVGRTAVLGCATAVAVYQTPSPLVFVIAAVLAGWSAVFLLRGPRGWVIAVDTGLVALLCLTQRWTVPPEALTDSTNWVLTAVSITAVAHQWYTGPATGAVLTAVLLGAHLTGNFLADPSVLAVSAPLALWTLGEAGLSRGLFLLVRTGARAADHELAVSEQTRRDAAVAAARRADEREYLSVLHDTAASTLLAVGTGMASGSEPWLRAQAARDLEVLDSRPETATRLSVPAGSMEIGGPPAAPMGLSLGFAAADSPLADVGEPGLSVPSDTLETGGPPGAPMGLSLGSVPTESPPDDARRPELSVPSDRLEIGGPPGAREGLSCEAVSADLVDLLASVVGQSPVGVEVRGPETVVMPVKAAEAVRGAVREALANVARHAGVDAASLTVAHVGGKVTVEVADQGRGFVPDLVSPHRRGVSSSIVWRMAQVGGRAVVSSEPGEGTRVRVEWPV